MLTTTSSVEDAEASILRVLRDAETPVPLRELDDLAPRAALASALTRLTRAGITDVTAGHISLSQARIHHEEEK